MILLYLMESRTTSSPAISVTVAYTAAMIVYFLLNKFLVFRSEKQAGSVRELLQFGIVVAINYLITQLIVHGLYRITAEAYSGSVIAGSVTISVSYLVFDRIIFGKKRPRDGQAETRSDV